MEGRVLVVVLHAWVDVGHREEDFYGSDVVSRASEMQRRDAEAVLAVDVDTTDLDKVLHHPFARREVGHIDALERGLRLLLDRGLVAVGGDVAGGKVERSKLLLFTL